MINKRKCISIGLILICGMTFTGCNSKNAVDQGIKPGQSGNPISDTTTAPTETGNNSSVPDNEEGNSQNPDNSQSSESNKPTVVVKPSVLKYGDKNDFVKALQEDLKKYGYSIEPDGDFGKATKEAINDFQTRIGLNVDGQAGEMTIAKLAETPTNKTAYIPIDYSNFTASTKESKETFMNTNTMYSDTDYFITVSLERKEVNIFKGENKHWELTDTFKCSVGKLSTPTITGRYRIGIRGKSFGEDEGFQCRYFTQIHGNYLFHSILYNLDGSVSDGRLGLAISHGCIRLTEKNAKWIYDNIPKDTQVILK